MRKEFILVIIAVFLLGWVSNAVLSNLQSNMEIPSGNAIQTNERASPSDWIKENNIHVLPDKIVIDLNDARWATFTDTNSMDPLFDSTANAIEIIPQSPNVIQVGDIISYESGIAKAMIIHRVIEKGTDEKGVYFILKGDNNNSPDPEKVRFEQVKRVLVAVIY